MTDEKSTQRTTAPSSNYKRYVLLMLTGVYTFNFIDRQILSILQEPIKADLNLSDTQLGLLTGLAFAALYVTLAIPIARYADRNNRKNVISLSLAFWSLMTAVSGMAQNFVQLLFARIGVGVGEAGGTPAAHSIISDYYGPEKRATALSIYSMGIYIGICLGFIVGGVIAHHYGWRMALFALGIPGILYALVFYFTVKEPIRGAMDKKLKEQKAMANATVMKAFKKNKTFKLTALATGFYAFGTYAGSSWLPSFLIRIHGMDLQTLGITIGLIAAIGGGLGAFSGGVLTDKLRGRDIRWYLWLPVVASLLLIPLKIVIFFAGDLNIVLIFLTVYYFISAMYLGPTFSVVQSLFPAGMRSLASAVLLFVLNAIGLGLGPLIVGMLSDYLAPSLGQESLRWAFTITFLTGIISAVLFYLAAQNYKNDLAMSEMEQ